MVLLFVFLQGQISIYTVRSRQNKFCKNQKLTWQKFNVL